MEPLSLFSPATRAWFERAFAAPTPAQAQGWPAIASGEHVLIQAPTGSGKTLAAFLSAIDRLNAAPGEGLRLLYVSPLKALNYDIERNLRGPLAGLESEVEGWRSHRGHAAEGTPRAAEGAAGHPDHNARVAVSDAHLAGARVAARRRDADPRRGARGRRHQARRAPGDLASSACRRSSGSPMQRIGLSATQRPIEEIGRFVSRRAPDHDRRCGHAQGARPRGRRAGRGHARARVDRFPLAPVPADGQEMDSGTEHGAQSIWPSIYPEVLRLVEAHRSTIVFVNNRRLAERLALRLNELAEKEIARAHHGSLAREQRQLVEEDLKAGRIPCLVATSSLELGIDMGAVDLVIQVESPEVGRARAAADRPRRPRARRDVQGAHLPEVSSRPARVGGGGARDARGRDRGDADPPQPAGRARTAGRGHRARTRRSVSTTSTSSSCGALSVRGLSSRAQLENVLDMLAGRYPSDEFAELRPRIVWDRTGGVIRARDGARRLAVTNAGHDPRPRALRRLPRRRRRPGR